MNNNYNFQESSSFKSGFQKCAMRELIGFFTSYLGVNDKEQKGCI